MKVQIVWKVQPFQLGIKGHDAAVLPSTSQYSDSLILLWQHCGTEDGVTGISPYCVTVGEMWQSKAIIQS